MRRKTLLMMLTLLLITGFSALNAQSLVIRKTDGTETSELLSSLQKLSFADGNLVLSYKSGTTELYALPIVQKLYFDLETKLPETSFPTENKLSLYPNPADQEIFLKNIPAGTSMIFIYRMDGKLMLRSFVSAGSETINISGLQRGFYMLVANNQTIKFIKL